MNIVIEGIDNSGKSTLARALAGEFNRPIISSIGPERFPGEINERVLGYVGMTDVIFDRHTCISHPIYGRTRKNTPIEPGLLRTFYDSAPILIYCRAPKGRGLTGHILKDHDTPMHLEAVKMNYDRLEEWYDEWALREAHIIRRWGDNFSRTVAMVRGVVNG